MHELPGVCNEVGGRARAVDHDDGRVLPDRRKGRLQCARATLYHNGYARAAEVTAEVLLEGRSELHLLAKHSLRAVCARASGQTNKQTDKPISISRNRRDKHHEMGRTMARESSTTSSTEGES